MTTCIQTLTASELKTADPRRFEREYFKWIEWQWDDFYAEDTQAFFKEKYEPFGIDIHDIRYSLGYCQSDFASFNGRVDLAKWMEKVQVCPDGPTYAERYPALYLACQEDGSYIRVTGQDGRRGWHLDMYECAKGVAPCGIFANMSEEDWDALVEEQYEEADLDNKVRQYCKDIGHELYDALIDSYEAVTSEDAFIESCEVNEITFEVEED